MVAVRVFQTFRATFCQLIENFDIEIGPIEARSPETIRLISKYKDLSDIMDLRHQSSAMCIIMLGGDDTHPWSATKVGNPIPATIPVDRYFFQKTAMI